MKETALISVIVPIYKVEQYLSKCVQSLLNQTYPHLEIILVDDGSPDGCGAICDEFAHKDSRIRVVHKKNGGLSDARNAGIELAKGAYLAFVDSDDWLEPDTYETMLALAEKHRVPMVCAGRFDEDGLTGEQTLGLCPEQEEVVTGQELVRRILRWEHLDSAAWDKLYGRELFSHIRYPVGRVVEDVPTTYRLALLAERIAMLPKPVYHYVHREQSITTAPISKKSFHAPEHAALVYEDIRKNLPALERDARYFLTVSQRYLVQTLDLEERPVRQKYAKEHTQYRRALRRQLGFAMGYDLFSAVDRVQLVLTAFGLFPLEVRVGRCLKQLRRKL